MHSTKCMSSLHTNPYIAVNLTKHPGPALVLLCIGTFLRIFDVLAHIVVPVHEGDFWKPGEDNALKGSKKSSSDRYGAGPKYGKTALQSEGGNTVVIPV
jgi:hypothetical protein